MDIKDSYDKMEERIALLRKSVERKKRENEELAQAKRQVRKLSEQAKRLNEVFENRMQEEIKKKILTGELSTLLGELEKASSYAKSALLNKSNKKHTKEWQAIIEADEEFKIGNTDNAIKLLKSTKKVGIDFAESLGYNLLFEFLKSLFLGITKTMS